MNIKEAICAEIERKLKIAEFQEQKTAEENNYEAHLQWNQQVAVCNELLRFIDSLPGQPVEGLEEEIERFKEKVGCPLYWCDEKEQSEWVSIIARHFAECGVEHLKK